MHRVADRVTTPVWKVYGTMWCLQGLCGASSHERFTLFLLTQRVILHYNYSIVFTQSVHWGQGSVIHCSHEGENSLCSGIGTGRTAQGRAPGITQDSSVQLSKDTGTVYTVFTRGRP